MVLRLTRAGLALALATVLSIRHWPDQIDDLYISVAYAHQWLTTGELTWTSGERVEGYSNFLWVVLLAGAEAVGADPGMFAQVASFASGAAFLVLLSWILPETLLASALVVAAGAWAPLGYWMMMGMETVFAGLLVAVGWAAVAQRRVSLGLAVLALAALTRPEAIGHVVLAAVWGRRWRPALLVGAALGVYHLLRHAWFGAWVAAPTLVKVGSPGPWQDGLAQAGGELVTAVGVLALAGLVGARAWALIPLLLQVAVLTRASGDWMGQARLLVPGVMGTLALAAAAPATRRAPRVLVALALAAAVVSSAIEPLWVGRVDLKWRRLPTGAEVHRSLTGGLNTPLAADVEFLVNQLPDPAAVYSTDVGMPGNVPGLRVYDPVGLVDRASAEWNHSHDPALIPIFQRRLDPVSGEVTCIRHAAWGKGGAGEPDPETAATYPVATTYWDRGQAVRMFCRPVTPPPPGTVVARWAELADRFPAQPWLAWHHGLALADDGRLEEALAAATPSGRRWTGFPPLQDLPDSLSFPRGPVRLDYQPSRGFALYGPGTLVSRPLDLAGRVELLVVPENPGDAGVELGVAWEGCPASETRTVHEVATLPLTPPACATGRVAVSFLNDASEGGKDRNVFLRVRDR